MCVKIYLYVFIYSTFLCFPEKFPQASWHEWSCFAQWNYPDTCWPTWTLLNRGAHPPDSFLKKPDRIYLWYWLWGLQEKTFFFLQGSIGWSRRCVGTSRAVHFHSTRQRISVSSQTNGLWAFYSLDSEWLGKRRPGCIIWAIPLHKVQLWICWTPTPRKGKMSFHGNHQFAYTARSTVRFLATSFAWFLPWSTTHQLFSFFADSYQSPEHPWLRRNAKDVCWSKMHWFGRAFFGLRHLLSQSIRLSWCAFDHGQHVARDDGTHLRCIIRWCAESPLSW